MSHRRRVVMLRRIDPDHGIARYYSPMIELDRFGDA
jgi:hypothetical protein